MSEWTAGELWPAKIHCPHCDANTNYDETVTAESIVWRYICPEHGVVGNGVRFLHRGQLDIGIIP